MTLINRALACLFALALSVVPTVAGARAMPDGALVVGGSPAQTVPSSCGVVAGNDYWLCMAFEQRNCSLVSGDQYWFCKGITDHQCGLIKSSDDYWFCTGLTTSACGVIAGSARYWLCEGITKQTCGVVRGEDYWLCEALQEAFRPEPSATGQPLPPYVV